MSQSETKTRQAEMSEWAQEWILEKLLRKIVLEFKEQVFMERTIMKKPLYQKFSWWFRFSREDTRKALKMLAEAYEGVELGIEDSRCHGTIWESSRAEFRAAFITPRS